MALTLYHITGFDLSDGLTEADLYALLLADDAVSVDVFFNAARIPYRRQVTFIVINASTAGASMAATGRKPNAPTQTIIHTATAAELAPRKASAKTQVPKPTTKVIHRTAQKTRKT